MKAATRDLFRRIFSVIKPPPNMTLSQWADKYRYLSKKSAAEPGKWKTSKAPYQREIMDAISDIYTRKVIVKSASQIGKTDGFILNTCGYYMDYDPSPVMILQPNVQPMAESFSKDRLTPMLYETPRLRGKVSKSRNSGNTILHKEYPGGYIVIVGASSPAGLSSRPIKVLLADEVDRYPPTAGKEGDPLLLASKRLTTFWNKKEVYISTPTIKGTSRIDVEYENSTQEVWHVPCPACGEYQPLEWAQVEFDRDNLTDGAEINYRCEKCNAVRSEMEWKELFTDGKFVAKFPDRPVRGFHLNALASLFVEWREIVVKFIEANEEKKKGNIEPLKVWTNTEMGQTWEEPGTELEGDTLYNRRERYNCEVPEDVIVLTAGVDTQDDRFEVEVVGWGVDKESWGIKYQIIRGDLKQEQVWKDLDAFLSQSFTRADGAKMHIVRVCIDAQGHFFNEVCAFCKARIARGIFPIRGVGGFDKPYIPRPSKNNRVQVPLFNLGVDTGKALLYQSLGVEEEGPNYCHFPKERDKGYTKDYFRGLTAERMVLTYKRGKSFYIWKLKEGQRRNEPLDIRNYAQAALEIANVVLKKPEDIDGTVQQTGRKRGRRMRSGGVD